MRFSFMIVVFLVGHYTLNAERGLVSDAQELRLHEASDFYIEYDPNLGMDQWRLIPHIGWRKFAPVDAYYYDWLDFRRITRWRWWRW